MNILQDIIVRQRHGIVMAVEEALETWTVQAVPKSSDLLFQAVHEYKNLEVLVIKSVGAYAARYDSTAERAKLPADFDVVKDNEIYWRVKKRQEQDMLKYAV